MKQRSRLLEFVKFTLWVIVVCLLLAFIACTPAPVIFAGGDHVTD